MYMCNGSFFTTSYMRVCRRSAVISGTLVHRAAEKFWSWPVWPEQRSHVDKIRRCAGHCTALIIVLCYCLMLIVLRQLNSTQRASMDAGVKTPKCFTCVCVEHCFYVLLVRRAHNYNWWLCSVLCSLVPSWLCDEMHVGLWRVDRVTSWLIATGGKGDRCRLPGTYLQWRRFGLWALGFGPLDLAWETPLLIHITLTTDMNLSITEPHSVPVSERTASRRWTITATILSSMYCRPTT